MLKKLDLYIIRKFLGTFLLSIVLILSITIVLDLTERIDKFFDKHAPLEAIIFDYYINVIPYFFNMLYPLFTFIAVIFFTSNLAGNSEIIAMQSSGMSYNRFLRPYFISATLIAVFAFYLGGYVIPKGNVTRLEFENRYIKKFRNENVTNVQLEVEQGITFYIENYDVERKRGYHASIDKFDGKKLVSRLTAERINYDTLNKWKLNDYTIRQFDGMKETLTRGAEMDTIIAVEPRDFYITPKESPQMTNPELYSYLKRQKKRGVGNIKAFEDEYYKRFSMPFAAFILTLMGVSLSSRKVRGGTGINLGIGLALSAGYVLFSTFSSSFSVNGSMSTMLAAWLPNIVFFTVAVFLYLKAKR
ncbi:MAG: LptF/LptG family permease [Prevotellaceae bacterium]|jgi:lipopolysaccharide export system permease protein|nr:LptF/LptG family permease [Prevotellaceae bacterium]